MILRYNLQGGLLTPRLVQVQRLAPGRPATRNRLIAIVRDDVGRGGREGGLAADEHGF